MEFANKNLLLKNRVCLANELDIEEVLQECVANHLFNDRVVEAIQSKSTKFDRNVDFLTRLPNRGPKAFKIFIDALLKTNQNHLVELLLSNSQQNSTQSNTASLHLGDQSESSFNRDTVSAFKFTSPLSQKRPAADMHSEINFRNHNPIENEDTSAVFFSKRQRSCGAMDANHTIEIVPSPCNSLSDLESTSSVKTLVSEIRATSFMPISGSSHQLRNYRMDQDQTWGMSSTNDLADAPQNDELIVRRSLIKFKLQHDFDSYPMCRTPKGLALIISIDKFEESACLENRLGGDIDRKRLELIFRQLGFRCYILIDGTAGEIWDTLQKFASLKEHETSDSMMIAVMTHGHDGIFYGRDGAHVSIEDTLKLFSNDGCPALHNKPKMLFFQSCRGDNPDKGVDEIDSPGKPKCETNWTSQDDVNTHTCSAQNHRSSRPAFPNKLPSYSDQIVGYATVRGYTAMRNTKHGSWYIQALVRVLAYHACDKHLLEIMTMVNNMVKAREGHCPNSAYHRCKEMSEFTSTLCKKLYFFPGL